MITFLYNNYSIVIISMIFPQYELACHRMFLEDKVKDLSDRMTIVAMTSR